MFEHLNGCLSFYDNNKTLVFGNNIFYTNFYDVNSNKAIVYILHELIHILQTKYINIYKNRNISEFKILESCFLNNNYSYSQIMPLHEYQAFFDSNYILYKYLTKKNKITDINNTIDVIVNLLYNNYHDNDLNYISPIEQAIKNFDLDYNYNNDFYVEDEIMSRLLFGMPISKFHFKKMVKSINQKKGLI